MKAVQNDRTLTIGASRLRSTKRSLLLNTGVIVRGIQSGHVVRTVECPATSPKWYDWPKPSVSFCLKTGENNRMGARWPPYWTDRPKRKVFVKDCSKFKMDESHRLAQGILNGTTGVFGVCWSKRLKSSDWRNRSLPDDATGLFGACASCPKRSHVTDLSDHERCPQRSNHPNWNSSAKVD